MTPRRRSTSEIAADLERIRRAHDADRDRLSLLHELQVYQEELLVQNEELTAAQHELEETRDRFVELYDFAPNGYLTLDDHGLVRQVNLTAATLLGRNKQLIEGLPLLGFLDGSSREGFLQFLRRCREARLGTRVEAELTLSGDGGRDVQLICRPRAVRGRREFLTAIIDVSERKRVERERQIAAEQHEALASRLLSAQDEERHRMARDLHDDVGQQVTALKLKLETLSVESEGALATAVADARRILERLDNRLHFMAAELRPAVLNLGVSAALEQFTSDWSKTFGVPAEFDASTLRNARLPPDIETHLYRIVQEALHNVAKHARASHVSVLLERKGRGIVLIVEDDGRGFDVKKTRDMGAMGLLGMRERAHLVGGNVEVESAPGRGTTLFVTVPLAIAP